MEAMKFASLVILSTALLFWVVALAGAGALSHRVCSNMADGATGYSALATARCSQMFSWQWWALFFELFVLVAALVMTLLPTPKHLASARPILAHFFTMASVVVMVAANASMQTYVWGEESNRGTWLSGGALGAGWIVMVMCNFAWICVSHLVGSEEVDLKMNLKGLRMRPSAAEPAGANKA